MRKLVSYFFSLSLLIAAVSADAQTYVFRVLANKGENQVKKAGTTEAVGLKTGSTLNADDMIISSDGAYIGLMHKTGKTTEVRGAGTKKVSEIEKQINTGTTSVASRYANFVAAKMDESENSDVRSKIAATGAVSRAVGGAAIGLFAPEQVDLLGDNAILSWSAPEGAVATDVYVLKVKNIFDEVIYQDETPNTFMNLDFTSDELSQNEAGLYLVKVYKNGSEEIASGEVGIKKVKEGDKVEIRESLENLKAEVSEDSPLNKIIYASFYEENGLIMDAITKYEEALQLAPEVEDFKLLYGEFRVRNGLSTVE